MKQKILVLISVLVVMSMVLAACGKNEPEGKKPSGEKTTASSEKPDDSASKKTFAIYNSAGMGEYYEKILIPAFEKAYGDKYDIKYETIGASDVITKIEAQGLQKGKGNINIVIMGDGGIGKGNESGVWMDLEDYKSEINYDDMQTVAQDVFNDYDSSVVPILFQHQDAGIAYVPTTDAGKALEAIIGEDGKITYDELKTFLLTDATNPRFGRGRIRKSGAGDAWTWGLFLEQGEYGKSEEPTKSTEWAAELYTKGNVKLYDGTSGTFTELTEGNLDVIAHSIPWFYRLHAKGKMENLPEELKEDTKGLENAKFALMEGDNVKSLAAGHYFLIPSNISDEMVENSLDFIKFAISPEMNAHAYAGIAMPAYKTSTQKDITDENVKRVWSEVQKYYPSSYLNNGNIQFEEDSYEFYVTDIAKINKYSKAWQDQVEAKVTQ